MTRHRRCVIAEAGMIVCSTTAIIAYQSVWPRTTAVEGHCKRMESERSIDLPGQAKAPQISIWSASSTYVPAGAQYGLRSDACCRAGIVQRSRNLPRHVKLCLQIHDRIEITKPLRRECDRQYCSATGPLMRPRCTTVITSGCWNGLPNRIGG